MGLSKRYEERRNVGRLGPDKRRVFFVCITKCHSLSLGGAVWGNHMVKDIQFGNSMYVGDSHVRRHPVVEKLITKTHVIVQKLEMMMAVSLSSQVTQSISATNSIQ
jgi:hypothetical protein